MNSFASVSAFVFIISSLSACARRPPEPAEKPKPNVVENYVQGLQGDVKRAETSRDAANAAVNKTDEELKRAGQDESL